MAFERDKRVQALQASFGNTDRAVQYLINGIPEIPQQQQSGGGGEGNQAEHVLRTIVNNPAFTQIKQLIRNDPSTLAPILQQISQTSP